MPDNRLGFGFHVFSKKEISFNLTVETIPSGRYSYQGGEPRSLAWRSSMGRKSQKDAILDATEKFVGKHGMTNLTLEAVAAEAGISKGGLLYHFASKKDLLYRVIERHNERMRKRRQAILDTLPEGPGRELKAYIKARLSDPSRHNMVASKMVSVMEDDDLREYVTNLKNQELQVLQNDGISPEKATVLIMAMEGLWMVDLFKIPMFTPEFREKVIAELMEMVDKSSLCSA